ncbi:hypothetical protein [Phocaeicola coprocola]
MLSHAAIASLYLACVSGRYPCRWFIFISAASSGLHLMPLRSSIRCRW